MNRATSLRARFLRQLLLTARFFNTRTSVQTLAAKRRSLARWSKLAPRPHWVNITPVNHTSFKGEWIQPETPVNNDTVVLYMYGGGFVFDFSAFHWNMLAYLTKYSGCRVFSLHYSLAPEHPFPAALKETLAAYKWLLEHHKPHNIVVAGDSSGATLVLSLLLTIKKHGLPQPACAVALCPATDAAHTPKDSGGDTLKAHNLQFFIDSYFLSTPRDHPIASPIYGRLADLPPLLVHIDKNELLHRNCVRFVHKARHAGARVDLYETTGLWHTWHVTAPYIPEATKAVQNVATFITKHTGTPKQ